MSYISVLYVKGTVKVKKYTYKNRFHDDVNGSLPINTKYYK